MDAISAASPLWSHSAGAPGGSTASLPLSSSRVGATAASPGALGTIKRLDFTRMTRQELFDWASEQVRSGKLSLDQATPIMAMTIKISATTGEAVDMTTDLARNDFLALAEAGIAGAVERSDHQGAERLRAALEILRKYQGQGAGVDLVA